MKKFNFHLMLFAVFTMLFGLGGSAMATSYVDTGIHSKQISLMPMAFEKHVLVADNDAGDSGGEAALVYGPTNKPLVSNETMINNLPNFSFVARPIYASSKTDKRWRQTLIVYRRLPNNDG